MPRSALANAAQRLYRLCRPRRDLADERIPALGL
jgi:hypothetical protein